MAVVTKKFTDLRVWQESHTLSLEIYKLTKNFPKDEIYSLSSQLRRASVSVSSNIAEGYNRFSRKEKIQFYSVSLGSVAEVHSQLMLARDLGYVSAADYSLIEARIELVHKALSALIKAVRS